MAYDKKKIFEQAKEAIEKYKLFFIEDVVAWLPIARSTFWEYYPDKSDEMDTLKELLEKNKVEVKSALRSKWFKGNNPLTQMALYKLIGTEEEYHRIASTKTENKNINIEKPIFKGIELDVAEDNGSGENS
ncbi:MAG: hypothetical protein ACOVOQ_11370 [Flavobacterium sp.]